MHIYLYIACFPHIYIYYLYSYIYIYIYSYTYEIRCPISYIQYGKVPIRDFLPTTPPHGPRRGRSAGRHGVGWRVGGVPYGYISILVIEYWIHIYKQNFVRQISSPSRRHTEFIEWKTTSFFVKCLFVSKIVNVLKYKCFHPSFENIR